MNKNPIKCSVCGKFISYKDITLRRVKIDYTPDAEYTVEKTEFMCLSCMVNKVLTK